jgi:hypothetical protein
MKLSDNKGFVLITALMFTLITLAICLGILFCVTQNIKLAASQKIYRNVTEASYGGVDLVTQEIIPRLFNSETISTLISEYSNISMSFGDSSCITQKLNSSVGSWIACSGLDLNPKNKPDVTFKLAGVSGQSFNVYSKIVDTVPGVPYVNANGTQLLGGGVADSSTGTGMSLSHYTYSIEIAGERASNPVEKSNISVLYEY